MNWYYALNGQQQGPVNEAELQRLLQVGTINLNTLVWREGLPDWQPMSSAMPASSSGAPTPPPTPESNLTEVAGVQFNVENKDVYVQQMREGVLSNTNQEYAGFWIRVVAKLIDGIVQNIIFYGAMFILSLVGIDFMSSLQSIGPMEGDPSPEQMAKFFTAIGLMSAVGFGFQIFYNGIMVGKYGATVGKMALRLKVVNADNSPITMGKAFGRAFADIVTNFTCLIGYVIAAFDLQKRALHDHIASTRVIVSR
ncbi:MAG: RDD family protein [Verrucomicrobiaceae bacterium]|nr:RDD family protein [Verrucomicrobiaceae bacterium]